DLVAIAREVEKRCSGIEKQITVAVMGCVVNGPGEAACADIGIAGGKDCAVLFKKGVMVRKLTGDIAGQLMEEIEKM
ncbi:MAG: flavodoxin-dependent (E)-4-hydroxy-3-methylbut-2-enyl-diphosphate synthase, partial [Oscillospiraceae bacterium]